MNKQCTKCGQIKSIDYFDVSQGFKDNHNNWCKECMKKYRVTHKVRLNKRKKLLRRYWRIKIKHYYYNNLYSFLLDGKRYVDRKGYYEISNGHFKVKLHRVIYCLANRCRLIDIEGFHIHHKDGNKLHNHGDNLEKLTKKEHDFKYHWRK